MDSNGKIEKSLDSIDSAEEEIRQRTEEYQVLHMVSFVPSILTKEEAWHVILYVRSFGK